MQFLTISNSKDIRIISIKNSTRSWQENEETRDSNFHQPVMQCEETVDSSSKNVQIFSSNLNMKLDVQINTCKGLDLAKFQNTIFIFKLGVCTILVQFLQSNAWFVLNDTQWTRLCTKIDVVREEFWSFNWEDFWREMRFWDLECVIWAKQLGLAFYITC